MKEIHAKMLRKHLQRLEQPLEGEDKLENAYDMKPAEEDTEEDVQGISFLLLIVHEVLTYFQDTPLIVSCLNLLYMFYSSICR